MWTPAATAAVLLVLLVPTGSSAAQLADGTPIHVRLLGVIDSESSRNGQRLGFVVTRDVVSSNEILIERGTQVAGEVVQVRRASWGFIHHRPTLAFRFTQMTTRSGVVIALRGSFVRGLDDRVVIDNDRRHHDLRWAGSADTFDAYVDGTYEL